MNGIKNIVVVQTAFIGDAVLTLPLVQVVKKRFPHSNVDVVVTPRAKELFANHPDIRETIAFDKRGADRGLSGLRLLAKKLRQRQYDLALVPHRSLRSALLVWLARIPLRVGVDRSAGRFLFTKTVKYRGDIHEVERNLSLLSALGLQQQRTELPRLYPSVEDCKRVDRLLFDLEIIHPEKLIAIAPGTVWNTKRWLKEHFASLAVNLDDEGFEIVLVGGPEDVPLCNDIHMLSGSAKVYSTAGKLSLLQSAELFRRCKVLVSNDSAPMHLAMGVGTPVVAIFGATVPEFGFGPLGPFSTVVETRGLPCRPCSIHGSDKCPIKTFECMNAITYDRVFTTVMDVLEKVQQSSIQQ